MPPLVLDSNQNSDFIEAPSRMLPPFADRLENEIPTILLLVRDSEVSQSLINLLSSKFRIVGSTTYEEGLRELRNRVPDLIIAGVEHPLKCLMTSLSGLNLNSIPVLAIGTDKELNESGKFISHGVTDFLKLPLESELTICRVRNYLQTHLARKKLAESLKTPLAPLTDLCEEALRRNQELEKMNRLKDDFLAMLSHELRNPINVIAGYSEVLLENLGDHELASEAARAIFRNAQFQSQLIQDLMDVSRSMNGKMILDCKPTELSLLINEILPPTRASASKKNIQINLQLGCTGLVYGDPTRISQVIWNLVSNAIKFTPEQGQIDILLENQGPWVVLSVRDNGVGIDPAFLPHIFEQFHQQDTSITKKYGGLGLGLTIVKNIVELHRGKVRAASSGVGHGSTFTVQIPSLPN